MQLRAWQWGRMHYKLFSSSILGASDVVISKTDIIFALMEHLQSERDSKTKKNQIILR